MAENIIKVIIDTTEGAEEVEIDLNTLSTEELRTLAPDIPAAADLYFQRLINSDK
jgi:hypothetical protein